MTGHKLKTVLVTYPLEPTSLVDRLRDMFEVNSDPLFLTSVMCGTADLRFLVRLCCTDRVQLPAAGGE